MQKMKCLIIEDNVIEILDEIEEQITKDLICCSCAHPCDKKSKCSIAMKNLLTDIRIFKESYIQVNGRESNEEISIDSTVVKQVLCD